MITFYAMPKFPSSDCSCNVQIWPLSFAPCPTHLFDPPCTDPSMRPRQKGGEYRVLVGKPEGKKPLGRPRHRWEDKIKMDLQ